MSTAPDISTFRHGRVPRALREEQLLTLAEELFSEHGFGGVSMDELARRAGVTKPVVYGIFGSKDGLFRACVDRAGQRLAELVATAAAAEREPLARLQAGGAAFFRYAAQHPGTWEVLFAPGGRFADARAEIRARQDALVAALLREALGGVPIDEERLQATATMLNGAYEALVTWSFDHPEISPETLASWVVALTGPGLLASASEDPAPKEHRHP